MSNLRSSTLLLPIAAAALYCILFFEIEHSRWFPLRSSNFAWRTTAIDTISGGGFRRPMAYLAIGVSGLFFLTRKKRPSFELKQGTFFLMISYLTWGWLSYLWADDPHLVLKRIISFTSLFLAAFALSRNMQRNTFLFMIWCMSSLYLVIGVVSELKLGTFSPFGDGYRFMGTLHAEGQGFNCALLLLSSIVLSDREKIFGKIFFRAVALSAFIFLLFTRSRGPFAGIFVAFIVYFFVTRKNIVKAQTVYLGLFILSFFILIVGGTEVVETVLLGRLNEVATLSGRIPLWIECLKFVKERFWIGHGFSGFWTQTRAWEFSESLEWIIESSHSIYLDITLNLGIVGLGLFLCILSISWIKGIENVKKEEEKITGFFLGLLSLFFVDGLLSSFVIGGGFATFLLLLVFFYLCFSKIRGLGERGKHAEARRDTPGLSRLVSWSSRTGEGRVQRRS